MPVDTHPLVIQIRRIVLKRWGNGGIKALVKRFSDHGDQLSPEQFQLSLQLCGVRLVPDEFEQARLLFDTNGDGNVSRNEFLRAIRGGLNERRRLLVDQVFNKFDLNHSGCVDLSDLRGRYDASRHPAVLAGKRTEAQVLDEFLKIFDSESQPDGQVTLTEFRDYYAGLSANITNDEEFELIVTNAWNFRSSEQQQQQRQVALSPHSRRGNGEAKKSTLVPSTDDGAFFSDPKAVRQKMATPKRVAGYTGHVPLCQIAVGESFAQSERNATQLQETWAVSRPPPAPLYESAAEVPQMRFAQRPGFDRLGRSSNTTTFKLE